MIISYTDFLKGANNSNHIIKENVQQAKDFLKKLEIQKRKDQGIDAKLTEEEVKSLEKNPYFLEIKKMLSHTPGLTYLFTKTFFKDWRNQWDDGEFQSKSEMDRCIDDLKNIYDELISKRDLWGLLPMTFDKYASLEPDGNDTRPSIERLTDDWRTVLSSQNAKQFFINRLLPFQKKWFKDAPDSILQKVNAIGDAFASFGKKDDGRLDKDENRMMNDDFFIKFRNGKRVEYVARFQTLGDLIRGAEEYINTSSKNSYKYVRDKIEEANRKYGMENGVDVIWEERGLMVVEIKSYVANAIVNANTSHCIKNSLSSWNSYVSLERLTRQYYLYNFNLPSSNSESVIGVTIDKNGKPTHAHAKRDEGFMGNLYPYMEKHKIPFDTLEPYSPEEQKQILRRIEANKVLKREGVSAKEIRMALENGGDVNAEMGLPLKNSIVSGDLESFKVLIDNGARVNIRTDLFDKFDTKKDPYTNLEIVSILVTNGVNIDESSYRSLTTQIKNVPLFSLVKKMLESGMDPNIMKGRLLRDGITRKDLDWVEQLSKYNLNFASREYMVLLSLLQQGQGTEANEGHFETKLFDIIFSKLKEMKDPIFRDDTLRREQLVKNIFEQNYFVCHGSDESKAKRIKTLLDKFVQYGSKSDHEYVIGVAKERLLDKS
ncbi:hypothetical protein EBU94_02735, partial [bacterium]|nr:hypothetical protein [bacterium]